MMVPESPQVGITVTSPAESIKHPNTASTDSLLNRKLKRPGRRISENLQVVGMVTPPTTSNDRPTTTNKSKQPSRGRKTISGGPQIVKITTNSSGLEESRKNVRELLTPPSEVRNSSSEATHDHHINDSAQPVRNSQSGLATPPAEVNQVAGSQSLQKTDKYVEELFIDLFGSEEDEGHDGKCHGEPDEDSVLNSELFGSEEDEGHDGKCHGEPDEDSVLISELFGNEEDEGHDGKCHGEPDEDSVLISELFGSEEDEGHDGKCHGETDEDSVLISELFGSEEDEGHDGKCHGETDEDSVLISELFGSKEDEGHDGECHGEPDEDSVLNSELFGDYCDQFDGEGDENCREELNTDAKLGSELIRDDEDFVSDSEESSTASSSDDEQEAQQGNPTVACSEENVPADDEWEWSEEE
jgi:hypothetical protein